MVDRHEDGDRGTPKQKKPDEQPGDSDSQDGFDLLVEEQVSDPSGEKARAHRKNRQDRSQYPGVVAGLSGKVKVTGRTRFQRKEKFKGLAQLRQLGEEPALFADRASRTETAREDFWEGVHFEQRP